MESKITAWVPHLDMIRDVAREMIEDAMRKQQINASVEILEKSVVVHVPNGHKEEAVEVITEFTDDLSTAARLRPFISAMLDRNERGRYLEQI